MKIYVVVHVEIELGASAVEAYSSREKAEAAADKYNEELSKSKWDVYQVDEVELH